MRMGGGRRGKVHRKHRPQQCTCALILLLLLRKKLCFWSQLIPLNLNLVVNSFNPYLPVHTHSHHNKPTQRDVYGYKRHDAESSTNSQAKWQDGYQKPPESVTPRDF